jgi:hypothetical protein
MEEDGDDILNDTYIAQDVDDQKLATKILEIEDANIDPADDDIVDENVDDAALVNAVPCTQRDVTVWQPPCVTPFMDAPLALHSNAKTSDFVGLCPIECISRLNLNKISYSECWDLRIVSLPLLKLSQTPGHV